MDLAEFKMIVAEFLKGQGIINRAEAEIRAQCDGGPLKESVKDLFEGVQLHALNQLAENLAKSPGMQKGASLELLPEPKLPASPELKRAIWSIIKDVWEPKSAKAGELWLAERAVDLSLFREGSLRIPTESDIIASPTIRKKKELTALVVQSVVVGFLDALLSQKDPYSQGALARTGRTVRNLLAVMEKEDVLDVVNSMADPDFFLFCRAISANLADDLGLPDLSCCTEERMACYIRNVSFAREDREKIPGIIEVCCERQEAGFRVFDVIERLTQSPSWQLVIAATISECFYSDVMDELRCVLASHPATDRLNRLLSDSGCWEDIFPEIPHNHTRKSIIQVAARLEELFE